MAIKYFIYTALVCAFGAFIVGCADLDYVDDYSESTLYDETDSTNKDNVSDSQDLQSAPEITPTNTSKATSTNANHSTKSAIQPKEAKITSDLPKIQPKISQDSQDSSDSRIVNKSTPRTKPLFDASRLNQPMPQLQTQCDLHDLQKCEDLGRIYAIQEKRDLATAHYKMACAKGKGRIMSCFFNSLIFANNGDDATSREYLDAIDADTLSALKIDEAELMLSIGEIALIKDKLKISCISGESTSCNALLSVFKIRGELGEARAFFSAECSRTKKQNATPCLILKNL